MSASDLVLPHERCGSLEQTTLSYSQRLAQLQSLFLQPTSAGLSLRLPESFWQFAKQLSPTDASISNAPTQNQVSLVPENGLTSPQIVAKLSAFFSGTHLPGHPSSPVNVIPHPTEASVLASLLPALQGPNLCSAESGSPYVEAEQALAKEFARRANWPLENVRGIFTFSGTGTMLYAMRIAIERRFPGSLELGLPGKAAIICSDQAHHACARVAGWLGLGQASVIRVPSDASAAINLADLEATLRKLTAEQIPIVAIIATVGTTDTLGIDPLEAIDTLRHQLQQELGWPVLPYLHADAVIAWPWLFFSQYDFVNNPVRFPASVLASLQQLTQQVLQLQVADSIGIDFHKTGFVPYTSSLLLIKQQSDLTGFHRQAADAPYFLRDAGDEPGSYTLETSRSGTGPITALASLWQLGETGFQVLLAHAVEMAQQLRLRLSNLEQVEILFRDLPGPAVLVRVYPQGTLGEELKRKAQQNMLSSAEIDLLNKLNESIAQESLTAARAGNGAAWGSTVARLQNADGLPLSNSTRVLKAFCLSPQMTLTHLDALVQAINDFR